MYVHINKPKLTAVHHLTHVQEAGLMKVEKEMSVEEYDIDAVKSMLNEVLDTFIADLGYGGCIRVDLYMYRQNCMPEMLTSEYHALSHWYRPVNTSLSCALKHNQKWL